MDVRIFYFYQFQFFANCDFIEATILLFQIHNCGTTILFSFALLNFILVVSVNGLVLICVLQLCLVLIGFLLLELFVHLFVKRNRRRINVQTSVLWHPRKCISTSMG